MSEKALVIIDIQNDITKHYRDVIDGINAAIDHAVAQGLDVVYICHNNLSEGTRNFKPGTHGAELVPEMHIASENVFTKTKANALTSEAFAAFIQQRGVTDFIVVGADATACVKSTTFNMRKAGYGVTVLRDCVTSYDPRKLDEMLAYYASKGCALLTLAQWTAQ